MAVSASAQPNVAPEDSRRLEAVFEDFFEGYLEIYPVFASSLGDRALQRLADPGDPSLAPADARGARRRGADGSRRFSARRSTHTAALAFRRLRLCTRPDRRAAHLRRTPDSDHPWGLATSAVSAHGLGRRQPPVRNRGGLRRLPVPDRRFRAMGRRGDRQSTRRHGDPGGRAEIDDRGDASRAVGAVSGQGAEEPVLSADPRDAGVVPRCRASAVDGGL